MNSAHPVGTGGTGHPSLGTEGTVRTQGTLNRGMGLLEATATNVISMVGVGPFLTIPFMVAAMNGPHVIYAWIAGLVLALADGLVCAKLSSLSASAP